MEIAFRDLHFYQDLFLNFERNCFYLSYEIQVVVPLSIYVFCICRDPLLAFM